MPKAGDEPMPASASKATTPRLPPILSLDFTEWDLNDHAYTDPAPVLKRSPVTDPALCQLHAFMHKVALQLRTLDQARWLSREQVAALKGEPRDLHDDVPLLDFSSAAVLALTRDSTDGQVVRLLQRGHYYIIRALFWIQTSYGCVTQVHLMKDIITSKRWTDAFCYVIKELTIKRGVLSKQEQALLRAKIYLMVVVDPDAVPVVPFESPAKTSAPPERNLVLALVREMTQTPGVNAEQVELTVNRLLPHVEARTRVEGILHAQFVLARLVASEHRPSAANRAIAAESRTWLRAFLLHGCRCVS